MYGKKADGQHAVGDRAAIRRAARERAASVQAAVVARTRREARNETVGDVDSDAGGVHGACLDHRAHRAVPACGGATRVNSCARSPEIRSTVKRARNAREPSPDGSSSCISAWMNSAIPRTSEGSKAPPRPDGLIRSDVPPSPAIARIRVPAPK